MLRGTDRESAGTTTEARQKMTRPPKRLKRAEEVVRIVLSRKLGSPCWSNLMKSVVTREAEILCDKWTEKETGK